ncbi:hypothetical protein DLREEDagrD3_24610 [Denitratisoma sp. agr-D3]
MIKSDTLPIALALLLAFCVIALGAYVRLSDAGLGCPDWPGCYGHLTVPSAPQEHAAASAAFPNKPVEAHKAWKEMVHRYAAGTLGLLILVIALSSWRRHNRRRHSPWVPSLLLLLVIGQALLGMWTVTLLLKPAVVTAHLLGGMSIFALLLWLFCRRNMAYGDRDHGSLHRWTLAAMVVVLGQIALGGWVSSNYAALMCDDFPSCRAGQWLPEADFAQGFQLRRELGHTASGELLPTTAMTAIHLAHRGGALVVCLTVAGLALVLRQHGALRAVGNAMLAALALQIGLGIGNVLGGLPLPLAVAHNAGAALLLATLTIAAARLWPRRGWS